MHTITVDPTATAPYADVAHTLGASFSHPGRLPADRLDPFRFVSTGAEVQR
ncbi:hypothetical protein [Leifsonia aquatica]|uniref:hypothetical protein n=1 Tax=Leifsonia aquatica TaxID=144185 RepID=UPI00382DA454